MLEKFEKDINKSIHYHMANIFFRKKTNMSPLFLLLLLSKVNVSILSQRETVFSPVQTQQDTRTQGETE